MKTFRAITAVNGIRIGSSKDRAMIGASASNRRETIAPAARLNQNTVDSSERLTSRRWISAAEKPLSTKTVARPVNMDNRATVPKSSGLNNLASATPTANWKP